MVADVHRTLVYGGIFLYPANVKSPKGKVLHLNIFYIHVTLFKRRCCHANKSTVVRFSF